MSAIMQYTFRAWRPAASTRCRPSASRSSSACSGVVNFAHGACFMLGAVGAAVLLDTLGLGFWLSLLVVPLLLFVLGIAIERLLVHRLVALDPLYNFLLTFGLSLLVVDLVKRRYGVSALRYESPRGLNRVSSWVARVPQYQLFVFIFSLVVCPAVWFVLTRTRVGMIVRASTENADLVRALGIDVGRWVTPVFGFGVALAGLSGVLAAPMRAVTADMGGNFVIILFAVVVIGGLGSIVGAVVAGFAVGLVEAFGQAYAPSLSQILIFVLMAVVVLVRPAGLFGREERA